jgi:predicted RNA-binding protein with PUA-like domain
MRYWLMKSEPDVFSIDDLERLGTASWEGVRNYQARNYLRDGMRVGDQALLYHSSCPVPGIAGVMDICREAWPDPTQFDRRSPYYDESSSKAAPRWLMVDVRFRNKLPRVLTLEALKTDKALANLALVKRGNRLSVMPVSTAEWRVISSMM